jgi:predicted RNase H-like HicB family nuclease
MNLHYSMVIRWSDRDDAFLVTFPELTGADRPMTHGETYEEAAKNGAEALDLLVAAFREGGRDLPEPAVLRAEPVS